MVQARIIIGKNDILRAWDIPSFQLITLMPTIIPITTIIIAESLATSSIFIFVRMDRIHRPIETMVIKIASPGSNCVSRKATAINTGIKVPEVRKPISTRIISTIKVPIGISSMVLKPFCASRGSE